MAALDTLFKDVAKQVVADLGSALNTSITYTRKTSPSYNTATGAVTTTDTAYNIKVPVEFLQSNADSGFQENTARRYVTPDLLGNSQPLLQDEVTLTFSGSTRFAKIQDIRTYRGGQEYLFRITVVF